MHYLQVIFKRFEAFVSSGVLLFIAVASILGIIASFRALSPLYLIILLLLFLFWLYKKRQWRRLPLFFICFLFFYTYSEIKAIHHTSLLTEGRITSYGEIYTHPQINGDKLSFQIKLTSNEIVQATFRAPTYTALQQLSLLKSGQVCQFQGELTKPQQATNFYAFDYEQYLKRKNIHWLYILVDFSVSNCSSSPKNHPLSVLKFFRSAGIQFVDSIYGEESKGLAQALIFGERSNIAHKTKNAYQKLGIIHLLAISGLHVGMLTYFFFYFLIRIGITKETVYNILLLLLPLYIVIAGGAPPVARACLMTMAVICSLKVNMRFTSIDSLSSVLLLFLLYDPFIVFDVGFQLSFVVTFALLLSAKIISRQKSRLMQLLAVTTIAQLSSLPLILYYFYEVSILSIIVNLFYVPIISVVILPCALGFTLLALLFPPLQTLASLLSVAIKFLHSILHVIEPLAIPLVFGKPSLLIIFFLYGTIMYLFYCWEAGGDLFRFVSPLLLLSVGFLFQWLFPYFSPYGKITFLDVGQGDCIVIELPFRRAVYMIDTGGTPTFSKEDWQLAEAPFEVGADIVAPYVKALGIRAIDKLILTHGDVDHIGGSLALAEAVAIKEALFPKTEQFAPHELEILTKLNQKGIPIRQVERGARWKNGTTVFSVLSPSRELITKNDRSIVLFFQIGGKRWLLTGDLEANGEQLLLQQYPAIRADVLKVAHHGSNTSTTAALLKQLDVDVAIISAGRLNRYGHPHPEVLERLREYEIDVFRTDRDGAITYKFIHNNGTFFTALP